METFVLFFIKVFFTTLGFFIGIIILNVIMPPPHLKKNFKNEVKVCPPHLWTYGEDGFLFCIHCKSKPSYSGRN